MTAANELFKSKLDDCGAVCSIGGGIIGSASGANCVDC